MNTGSSTNIYNFDNFNSNNTFTNSNISTGNVRTTSNTTNGMYTGNTRPTPTMEVMDLSFATDQVAQESKSILDKVGDFFGGLASGAKETGAKIVSGAKSAYNWVSSSLQNLGSSIMEAATNLASNAKSILGGLATWAKDTAASVFSTAAVVVTSVVSGVANIVEGLADGLIWCSGKLIEGSTWIVGKMAGLFSEETEEDIMAFREDRKELVKEVINKDVVGDINDWFYQDTVLGKSINENSALKYDSKLAKGITKVTEVVGKIAAATAATILTGGATAPLLAGFLYGTGTKSEEVYNKNQEVTGSQELGIFISGLGEAANWYAQGKLGEGALNLINTVSKLGIKATGATALDGIKSALSQVRQDGLINTLKGIKGSTSLASLKAEDNFYDSLGIIADNYSDCLIGDKEFNRTNALKAIGELGAAWLSNMFFDGAGDYLMKNGRNIKLNEIFGDHIEAKNLDLDATLKMISISELDKLAQDPEIFEKFTSYDSASDTFLECSKIELANALKDYLEGIKKNNYDFGYSAEQLAKIQKVIDNFAVNPSEFNMDSLVEKYETIFKNQMFYNSNPEIILEPEFQIAMNKDVKKYALEHQRMDYYEAAQEMENYYNMGMNSLIARGIDVGEANFKRVATHILSYDNPSIGDIIYLKTYLDKGYDVYNSNQRNLADQLVRIFDLKAAEKRVQENIAAFAGNFVETSKIETIRGSFVYQTEPVFIANYKDGTSVMAYNNGTTSVINLNYDTNLLKSNMTHESLHQVSHVAEHYDETGAYLSKAGLKVSTWNINTKKWDSKNRGLNEATTEYFSKLIHGDEYIKGTCGYEPMVDKLEEFMDSNLFTLDQLKEAYFTNKPELLKTRLDEVGEQIGIDDFGDKFMEAFDKANISNNKDDIGEEAAKALEIEGMQSLTKYLKKVMLAGL